MSTAEPSLFDQPGEHTPEQHRLADNRISMSVVMVEATGPQRCAHAAHIADADDDEIADEWVRTLLAAAQLRGSHLVEALRARMRNA